jgi:hypothetical protein
MQMAQNLKIEDLMTKNALDDGTSIPSLVNSSMLDRSIVTFLETLFKYLSIIFIVFYILVSAALIKQIKLMSKTVVSPMNKYLVMIGYFHLIFVTLILLLIIFAL